MAFVGINGVGKSTSLAKVAYYLKQNGIKVLGSCRCEHWYTLETPDGMRREWWKLVVV